MPTALRRVVRGNRDELGMIYYQYNTKYVWRRDGPNDVLLVKLGDDQDELETSAAMEERYLCRRRLGVSERH